MRISFVLPGSGDRPVGGFKVVYEYANGLVHRGHKVTVIHAPYNLYGESSFTRFGRGMAVFAGRKIGRKGGFRPDSWFCVDPDVQLRWVPSLHPRWIPEADAIVATAWETAEWVNSYGHLKGKKYYLIHDYEHFMTADEILRQRMAITYNCGMFNIATSPAGKEMLNSCGAPTHAYIPNGLDFKILRLKKDIDDSSRTLIGFPTRKEAFKGTKDAIAAMTIVRERFDNNIQVWSFGGLRPDDLPHWIDYYERPSDGLLSNLYNQSQIFVVASHYEGWGLPGSEAMACGAALVSTDNGGVRAYAEHGKTALISQPKDPHSLGANIIYLLQNQDFRIRIAKQGHHDIQQFTWDRAVSSFEKCIMEAT